MDHLNFSGSARCEGLDSLLADGLKHLEKLGYNPGTVANYRNIWKKFRCFAQDRKETQTFSANMIDQFLTSYGISSEKAETGLTFRQRQVRTVMRVLSEFALHGCFQLYGRRRKEVQRKRQANHI